MSPCDLSHQQRRSNPQRHAPWGLLHLELQGLLRFETLRSDAVMTARCRRIALAARSFPADVSFAAQRRPSLPHRVGRETDLGRARGNVFLNLLLTWRRQASSFHAASARV